MFLGIVRKVPLWDLLCRYCPICLLRSSGVLRRTIRLSTRYETRLNVTKCHACHAKRSYATLETSKSDPFCRTYHRHGNTALTRTVADGCERLRTVADVNATSSEHTLNPQTPRVKREPLLRIREKHVWKHLKKTQTTCCFVANHAYNL